MAVSGTEPDYKKLLLQLIASLTLCDHMGDVGNEVDEVVKRLGIPWNDEESSGQEWGDLPKTLHGMGVTTLGGTEVWSEDDD